MTLNIKGDKTPNNDTRTSDKVYNNNNNNKNTTANGTKKKKKKKKRGNGGSDASEDNLGKVKFERQSKEDAFKGIVLECGTPVIQARIMREAYVSHANAQKQPHVADSIFYKSLLTTSDFVTAVEDPTQYKYDDAGTTKVDPLKKKAEEARVSFLIKFQTQAHSQATTLEQTLFNIVCGQCSASFLLAIQDKCNN